MALILVVTFGISLIMLFPIFIDAQSEQKTFVTHSGKIIKTSGEVLDPIYTVSTVDFDPDLFLRNFEYGRISTSNDQTIREFTIIAEDDKVQEISPGVFYNVWTFNGTVPGPTIRATEGDLVRIHFINNGSKSHTMHFHGIHQAEMDGVFEIVGEHGGQFTYEFEAGPVGVHPYHCHVIPVQNAQPTDAAPYAGTTSPHGADVCCAAGRVAFGSVSGPG